MKKVTKILTIIAACLIVVGIALSLIGKAMGGKHAYSIDLTSGLRNAYSSNVSAKVDKYALVTNAEDIKTIVVNVNVCNLSVNVDPNATGVTVQTTIDSQKITPSINDSGVLEINSSLDSSNDIGFSLSDWRIKMNMDWNIDDDLVIEITVPSDELSLLDISNKYGDISINGVNSEETDIVANCGDINLNGCEVSTLNLTNDYGTIGLSGTAVQVLSVNNKCGDISFTSCELESGSVTDDYGDISFTSTSSGLANITDSCGDISIKDCSIDSNLYIENSYGDVDISNPQSICIYDVDIDNGDIDIDNDLVGNDRTTTSIITADMSCGDFTVS